MALSLKFFITILMFIITISPSSSSPQGPINGFKARLIHRNSPQSPYYNPDATRSDLIKSSVQRSLARQRYFELLMSGKTSPNDITGPIDVISGDYIMKYSIGSPPVETFGNFDTGSTITWLQCQPCEQCYKQRIPIYDPKNSSSYHPLTCQDEECRATPFTHCQGANDDPCNYKFEYQDGSSSSGVIALETIMLEYDELSSGNINLTNMIVGCGRNNQEPWRGENPPGVVGFSREYSSWVGQLFYPGISYCIAPNNIGGHSFVKFNLPKEITGKENQTPLLTGVGGLYYLSLEGISVGGTPLNISNSIFKMTPDGRGGIFIDTGTSYCLIDKAAMGPLTEAIKSKMGDQTAEQDRDRVFPICYRDISRAPEVAFQFTGLGFPLSRNNTWRFNSHGQYCLAIRASSGYSILGLYQQRGYNVGFDLDNNLAYFKVSNSNCQ